ncbi:MAG TPA: MMPL family transporter [Woeseiaceae bacterium]|nr:MMPL family transporter [Woeseiaceae bacterium]
MNLRLSRPGAWLIVLALTAVTVALGFAARQFEIDASADTLLTRDNEKYLEYMQLREVFAPEEFLLVAYQPTDRELFSAETFGTLRELRNELRALDRVATVRSILDVPLPTLADTGIANLDAAALSVDAAGWSPQAVAGALEGHPIYENLIVDDEQTVTALQVVFEANEELAGLAARQADIRTAAAGEPLTEAQTAELEQLDAEMAPMEERLTALRSREVEQIRAIVAPYEESADIYLGGVHALGKQLIDIVESDLVVFGGTVLVLISALLLLLFRDWRWLLIAIACCVASIVCTVGLFALLELEATAISANFVALQLILTLAVVVHLVVRYRELARERHGQPASQTAGQPAGQPTGQGHAALVGEAVRSKTAPILYAAGSTVVGFVALLITDIQPVISFGWMMAIAVSVSLVITLCLFPALLTLLGPARTADEPAWLRRGLERLAGAVLSARYAILAAAFLLFVVCMAGLFRLDVENSFIDYFAEDTDVHRELTFIDRNLGGSTPLDVIVDVPPGEGDLLLEAETFTELQKMQALFERHAGVGKILSLVNFTALAREVNDGRPLTEYEMTAAYLLMDEELRESLVGSYYSPETGQARFSIRIQDTTEGLDRSALLESLHDDVQAVVGPDREYTLSNLFVLYEDILTKLSRSQLYSLLVVLAALFVAFLAFFRSFKLAVIALVPNLLVVATVFGTMAWFGIPLDLMTMTIAAVAMGIAVDDTVHYVHRFREEDGSPADAVRATNSSVGFAVCYTTLIIVAGFFALVFSDFVPTTLFGVLTGVALTSALVFDMTVLPILLERR